jgi:hypothetical protein
MADAERPLLRPSAAPEEPVVCPICQVSLAGSDYETHLRTVHHLYGYRGVRRTLDDTVEAMLDDLLTVPPFAVAWPALVRLARAEHGPRIETFLAGRLGAALARLPPELRGKALPELVRLVAPGNAPLIAALAGDREIASREFALAALGVLPGPLDPLLMRPLRALLLDRRLPEEMQLDVLAAVLPTLSEPALVQDFLEKFTSGLHKTKAVTLLRSLEQRIGQHPTLMAMCDELQEQVKMSCPRCGARLRRPAMTLHLWDEHRLVLDGLKVRDPWSLIEEWLDAAKANHDPELLERCRIAAAKIDDAGPARLQRLMLARGLADAEARRTVLAEAREHHAACCPWCFAEVTVPPEGRPLYVNFRPGRLSGGGYEVEIDERGLFTSVVVQIPADVLYRGSEPNRQFTSGGVGSLASGPIVLLAFLVALVWPTSAGAPLWPVAVLLTLAWTAHLMLRLVDRGQAPISRRLLDYTWRFLVPRLHENGFVKEDSAFLAGLADLHRRVGAGAVMPEVLTGLVRLTEQAVKNGDAPASHLSALCRLEIEMAAAAESDPVPLAVRWLARCFDGRLPLAFAQRLLEDWVTNWWTPANLARLRILLCDQAFEAGFEIRNLIEAGQNAPALGTVLQTDSPQYLAALRLLWSQRPTRPWDRLGAVLTAFELAANPHYTAELANQPDVLLWEEDSQFPVSADDEDSPMTAAHIVLTPAGVSVQGMSFHEPPRVFEVRIRTYMCEMYLGPHTFRSPKDLDPLARLLERWFRFGFHEFLPQIEGVLKWQSPDRAAIVRAWGAVPCPTCSRYLLPRVGEVGIALDET